MEPLTYRQAAALGITPAQLRTRAWTSPVHNAYLPSADADDLGRRCLATQLVLPDDAVFTHLTAAQLRQWWLPDVSWPHLIASSHENAPHLERRGVYVRRCAVPAEHKVSLDGVRVTSASRTLVELAEHLGLVDLVICMDSALFTRACALTDIRAALVPGRRGVRVLRRAIGLCDGRSESPWETVLRLVHQLSGIDVVEPQYVVRDPGGAFLAQADLRLGRTQRLVEYDGADHLVRAQQHRDLRRDKSLRRWHWERYGYVATEIHRQPHMIIRDAEDALGLARDPSRVDGWLDEYQRSSLTAFGRTLLVRRLRRFVRASPPRRSSRPC